MPGRGNRYGGKWPEVRARHLREFPWCAVCLDLGQNVLAIDVDHIVRAKPAERLFWQRSNHRSLCKTHHASKSGREAHGLQERHGCGIDGMPLARNHPWNR